MIGGIIFGLITLIIITIAGLLNLGIIGLIFGFCCFLSGIGAYVLTDICIERVFKTK